MDVVQITNFIAPVYKPPHLPQQVSAFVGLPEVGVALPHLVTVVVDRVHGVGGVACRDRLLVQRFQCRNGLGTLLTLRRCLMKKKNRYCYIGAFFSSLCASRLKIRFLAFDCHDYSLTSHPFSVSMSAIRKIRARGREGERETYS